MGASESYCCMLACFCIQAHHIIDRFQVVAMQWCILIVLWLWLLIVLWLQLLIILQLWLLVVLQLQLLIVVGLLIIDVGLMMVIVVGFLVSDRAPIVVGFSIIVIFVIVAGHVEWSERLEQGGHSMWLHCNVIVEGGRWILCAMWCVSPFGGGVSCSTQCILPFEGGVLLWKWVPEWCLNALLAESVQVASFQQAAWR